MAALSGLLSWIQQHPAYQKMRDAVQEGITLPSQALISHTHAPVLSALVTDLHVPMLVVVPTVEESRRLVDALRLWLDNATPLLRFPEPPVLFYEHAPWTPEVINDRLDVLSALYMGRVTSAKAAPPVIITSARALMQRTLPYRQFRKATRKITAGSQESLTELARHALEIGYESVTVVQAPGQFSRRGGLLDLFPAQSDMPYRLEFFGDEIDTIRAFDPATQRSSGRVENFWLGPVREVLPRDNERAMSMLSAMLDGPLPTELRSALEADAQALEATMPFPYLEFYLPYLYQEVGTLLNYLPPDTCVVLSHASRLPDVWQSLEEEAREQRQHAIEEGYLPHTPPDPHVHWDLMRSLLDEQYTLSLDSGKEGALIEAFTPEIHFAGRLPEAMGRLRQWTSLGDQVVVASRQAARMAELWQDFNPPPVHKALTKSPEGLISFVQVAVPGGWQWHGELGTRHLLTDEELFGWRPPEPRRQKRRRATSPEFSFSDLQPGDVVVHEDYGIAVFQGLVTRGVDDIEREYLLLEYANRDKLYVPIHQADRLTRYVGAEGLTPGLHRLGDGAWETAKARVEKASDEMAAELLELYAARQVTPGYAFSKDTPWQKELEVAFPYLETEDQVRAIAAVKGDMEQPRPMDRLICGDAGYGKTEVALRAAFKAVMDGKQVAMLVPTTVLAQQHYETFHERLEPFPIQVELLSRFRTASEQHKVLERLKEGKVDIVIGTHRLLQKDVAFKDLGVVIIDEEQRFGVAHKERLKRMRTEVDVLTMTATPIPRTLHLALSGVRDISIIETPPQERLPIATYIGPYDSDVTRRAILREIKRGGQVFYVHNRVESIRSVALRLKELVPEARVEVAHGQMRERDLARVMRRFTADEVDVLLATTIIESGLDFPNANTLIVERADRFGLAQLYQLRGRVGRGTRRGYAYFFHKRRMNEDAQLRLQALDETSSRGGGFSVALRDLEIRGTGEILGHKQHGHVVAVGFTLYTRLLSKAVSRLKAQQVGQPLPPEPIGSITIELPLAVGLPSSYVPDDKLRLQLYRRLAELRDESGIARLEDELRDRFGPLPLMAQNLLYQLKLKLLARDARIPSIVVENAQIALRPPWLKDLPPEEAGHLRRQLNEYARVGRRELWIALSWDDSRWRENLQAALETLVAWWER